MKEKKKKRIKVFLTIDEDLYKNFDNKRIEKCIDKSLLFESFIKDWLNNQDE